MAAVAPTSMSPSGTAGVDLGDSNMSSPLSEVDDKDTNDDDINMHLDHEGDDKTSTLSTFDHPEGPSPESDSDSALSDAQSVANSEANDTEAETERLFDTPRHQRQRDVVVDQFNEGQVFEHSPSKLKGTAAADEEVRDDESLSEDAVSNPPTVSDVDESPAKVATTKDTSADDEPQLDSQDRKRKRSAAENSEDGQPSRKRTGSVGPAEAEPEAERVAAVDEEDTLSGNVQSALHSPVNGQQGSPEKQDAPAEESEADKEQRLSRKITRNGLKSRSGAPSEPVEAAPEPPITNDSGNADADADEEAEPVEEAVDHEAEEEAEAEAAARNAEERKSIQKSPSGLPVTKSSPVERKQAAFKDWSKIEEMFGIFRDR